MKKQNGITLISLVITIIVLLILAGVSINAMIGNNGILANAQDATKQYELESLKEQVSLDLLNEEISGEELTEEKLYTILSKYGTVQYEDYLLAGTVTTEKGLEITISEIIGDTTVTFYANSANEPKLSDGMIPVKYDTTSQKWVICSSTDEEWYSYTTKDKKWANVMLSDGKYNTSTAVGTVIEDDELGSMFVWIPRFAYQITEGYHSNEGSLIAVFLIDNTNTYKSTDGYTRTVKKGTDEGVTSETNLIVHPAFTTSDDGSYTNGEWKTDIEGLWVAKFQAGVPETLYDSTSTATEVTSQVTISGMTSSASSISAYYPVFKGKRLAYNYSSASQCYDLSLALDDSGNPYGLTTSSNAHLMKNSEWGAVAYLSISQYGYSNGSSSNEKYKNNLSIIPYGTNSKIYHPNYSTTSTSYYLTAVTGYTATGGKTSQNYLQSSAWSTFDASENLGDVVTGNVGESYAWDYCDSNSDSGKGTLSSTTGNIYGIYDMGGCLADYTAAYINDNGATTQLATYGSSFANGTSSYLSTAYPAIADGTRYDFNSSYSGFENIFGDAIWETSSGTGANAWFGQTLEEDTSSSEVFFPRGGCWSHTTSVGLCGLNDGNGSATVIYGFHTVLVVE